MLQDVLGAEDALQAAALDVELMVAEAVAELVWLEVPVRNGAVAEILAEEDVECADDVSHHAVADYDDFFETAENAADL